LAADRFNGSRAARAAAAGVGIARVVVGGAVLVRPTMLPAALGIDSVTARRTAWAVRMFAARDAVLGLGTVWAVAAGAPVRPWLLGQAAGDATDAAVFGLAAWRRQVSPVRGAGLSAFAVSGVLGALAIARGADRAPDRLSRG